MIEALTPRQTDVIELLAEGYSNSEIANELVVSDRTVQTHLTDIYRRLDVDNRTEAAILWLTAQHERQEAELKRRVDDLEGELSFLRRLSVAEAARLIGGCNGQNGNGVRNHADSEAA